MKRVVYASFSDAMTLVRKAKQKKIAYSYWELEELDEDVAKKISDTNFLRGGYIQQEYPSVKNFLSEVQRKKFMENPVKITFFLEKQVDQKI